MKILIPNFFKYEIYMNELKIGSATSCCKWAIKKSLENFPITKDKKIKIKFIGLNI